ncbi:peptidoglycan DD-metalloendopeptidase family protein [Niallia oryzisoli]|uniref:peptidoglycan DD-metalloendopeptidase family protein n=1 Tax=Niallia oryzisoli TaxID=1737571 RepID=UPI00373710B4
MRSRSDDIRKRIEKRKKQRERTSTRQMETKLPWTEDEERYGFDRMTSYESGPVDEENHPLFRKEVFIFKLLASACVVLVIAIMFRNPTPALDPAREFVTKSMNEEFQFAAVSDWYESTFGKTLALLPTTDSKNEEAGPADTKPQYALPASGKILEDFGENGQRITIETGQGAAVEAMNEGLVRFIGKQDGFGQTVVIQHADKSESWYGNLSEVDVTLYQYIEKGTKVGKATDNDDGTKGSFYFAIKEGEDFVDPIQVIQFD